MGWEVNEGRADDDWSLFLTPLGWGSAPGPGMFGQWEEG